jgi:hypothetical protein
LPFALSLGEFPRDISRDDPAAALIGFAYHDYDDVLAAPEVSIPACKEPGAAEALAEPNLIWIGKGGGNQFAMCGQEIGMPLCNMPFPLFAKLYFAA